MEKFQVTMKLDNVLATQTKMKYYLEVEGQEPKLLCWIKFVLHTGIEAEMLIDSYLRDEQLLAELYGSELRAVTVHELHGVWMQRAIKELANLYSIPMERVIVECATPMDYPQPGDEVPLSIMSWIWDQWEFTCSQRMMGDPNLVPWHSEWEDNLGGMGNAIFWLEKNWTSKLNAQGDRILADGTRELWSYSPVTETIIHHNRKGIQTEIDRNKMLVITKGDRDNATIYRPFFRENPTGPRVEWLCTRKIVVESKHHYSRAPLHVSEMLRNLEHLTGKMQVFRDRNYMELVVPLFDCASSTNDASGASAEMAVAYLKLIRAIEVVENLERRGIASSAVSLIKHYIAVDEARRQFTALLYPNGGPVKEWTDMVYRAWVKVAVDAESPHDAQILFAMWTRLSELPVAASTIRVYLGNAKANDN